MKITKKQYVAIAAIIIFIAKQYGLDAVVGLGDGALATVIDLVMAALIALGIVDNTGGE